MIGAFTEGASLGPEWAREQRDVLETVERARRRHARDFMDGRRCEAFMRWLDGSTLAEVGSEMGVSAERARQLIVEHALDAREAMGRRRRFFEAYPRR